MSQTPLHDRTNTFGLPTPPRPELPALSFNSQFTATNFFSSNENTTESPATVEPPRKRRKVASDEPFSNKSDTEVWELSDEDIIAESVFSIQELCYHNAQQIEHNPLGPSATAMNSLALVCQTMGIAAQSQIFPHVILDPHDLTEDPCAPSSPWPSWRCDSPTS
ncbi:hypothetical protein DFH09DRAFT_1379840 [Mycena vulgaris]|nr:hypothetical protein DFH09DRAFT_1379840 [Mycena vulgaris]